MVTVTINGQKKDRAFQNMAQALAFAYQSGECYNAEKLELAYASSGAEKPSAEPRGAGVTKNSRGAGIAKPPEPPAETPAEPETVAD